MPKFKVGDSVIGNCLADSRYSITRNGWTGRVVKVHEIESDMIDVLGKDLSGIYTIFTRVESFCFDLLPSSYATVQSYSLIKKETMNLKEKFLLALKSEPEKSFRKVGITNGDDLLTQEGTELFLN